jgi:hypothetical protein
VPRNCLQLVEEPPFGGLVKVIGRFVQHHRLGLLIEDAHQVHAPALSAGERGEVLEQKILFESEPVGQTSHFGLGFVATAFTELLFERGEARDGLVGRIGRQSVAGVLHVRVQTVNPSRRQDVRQSNRFDAESPKDRLLGQVRQSPLMRHRSGDAQVLGVIAEEHGQQCGLAGAVAPHQTNFFAVADGERDRF